MTEPTTPEFNPETDADTPAEPTASPEGPAEPTADASSEPTPAPAEPTVVEPTPEVHDHAVEAAGDYDNEPELAAQPVSGVPTPGAVSDPKPEQTDNTERPEDGEQDVSQDPNEVPADGGDPDVVA